ncbi:unnamed protein product [Polarella glacialis]|uniref:SGNH hydrolase-type esterase domain-containing protein n=1 Tax=Polarella glacialis TaxID=89957 RepID=A0A813JYH1_POLGL|nr:unnamed protein product [Polarella glacialis]
MSAATCGSCELLELFEAGEMDGMLGEFHSILRRISASPPDCRSAEARQSGVPQKPTEQRLFGSRELLQESYVPLRGDARPKLVLLGDELTLGDPVCSSASFAVALAEANPQLLVENAGFAGLMSLDLDPAFGQVPPASAFGSWAVVIIVGTNDAMAMCGPEDWVEERFAFCDSARPSVELFERSLTQAVKAFAKAGAIVAVSTPPPLGEDLECTSQSGLRHPPMQVIRELAAAVHRVASAEGCAVLPVLECAERRLQRSDDRRGFRSDRRMRQSRRGGGVGTAWTPAESSRRLQDNLERRKKEWAQNGRRLPWTLVTSATTWCTSTRAEPRWWPASAKPGWEPPPSLQGEEGLVQSPLSVADRRAKNLRAMMKPTRAAARMLSPQRGLTTLAAQSLAMPRSFRICTNNLPFCFRGTY